LALSKWMRDGKPQQGHRDRSWWIERDAEANHHAAIDVDRQRDPRAPDRQALFPIDHDDVEFGVIDLDDVKRPLRHVEGTGSRRKAIGGPFAMRTAPQAFAHRQGENAQPDRIRVRCVQTRAAAARNFLCRRADRTLLPAEVVVLDSLREDLLDGWVEPTLPAAAVRFLREQGREQARPAIQPRPAVQRCRGAVAGAGTFNNYRTGAARSIEQWSDEISPAPGFRPIAIADVVQVCRRIISGFCARRTEFGDSQTLDFAGLRIFDKNGIEAKSPGGRPTIARRTTPRRLP
jgi:hypothetical protein